MQTHANSQSVWTYYPRPQHVCHICVRRVPHCAFHTTRGSYKLIYGSFRFTERLYWPKFDMLYCAVTDLNKNVTPDRHFSRTVPQYNTILTTWLKVKVLSILRWCKSSLVKTCAALPGGRRSARSVPWSVATQWKHRDVATGSAGAGMS